MYPVTKHLDRLVCDLGLQSGAKQNVQGGVSPLAESSDTKPMLVSVKNNHVNTNIVYI